MQSTPRPHIPLLLANLLVVCLLVLAEPAAATQSHWARTPTCAGEPATVVGTAASDDLRGTPQRDVVVARDGDDQIRTGAGRDLVCAGDAFDFVRLGRGADRALGSAGDDTVHGGDGVDRLRGQSGIDQLDGGAGDDELFGGRGAGIIIEGFIGGPGDDRLIGGPGLDSALFFNSPRGVQVNLTRGSAIGQGVDVLVDIEGVVGSNSADTIVGDETGNGLFGQTGADVIRAGGSGRIVDGTSDVISGDDGNDTLIAGPGQDLVAFGRLVQPVSVDLAAGTATGQGSDVIRGAEGVIGSRLDDDLLGGPLRDYLAGSTGDDTVNGAGGRDVAVYRDVVGPIEASLSSGLAEGPAAGMDSITDLEDIWGTADDDRITGNNRRNILRGFAGDDHLTGLAGIDLLDGGGGTDTCDDRPAQLVRCEATPPRSKRPAAASPDWSPWLALAAPA